MRTEEIKIYNFDELSDEAKDKAIAYANEHWTSDNVHFEFEQLQYELSDIVNMFEGSESFPQYVWKLCKDGDLQNVKCTRIDADRSNCEIEFELHYNDDSGDESEIKEDRRYELASKVKADLEYWALKNWRSQMKYISIAEYWKAEFEANDREFTENGSLYR